MGKHHMSNSEIALLIVIFLPIFASILYVNWLKDSKQFNYWHDKFRSSRVVHKTTELVDSFIDKIEKILKIFMKTILILVLVIVAIIAVGALLKGCYSFFTAPIGFK